MESKYNNINNIFTNNFSIECNKTIKNTNNK